MSNKQCFHCHTTNNLKKCELCKNIRYCSKKCQAKDWNRHKLECFHTDICPICHDTLTTTNLIITKCSHRFHLSCFLGWYNTNPICPYCRTSI